MCEFERAKCVAESSGISLKVYSEGECITLNSSCDIFQESNVKCSEPGVEFLCASNNLTYGKFTYIHVSGSRCDTILQSLFTTFL